MRYLPLTDQDRKEMLDAIGVDSIDDLFKDVPVTARQAGPIEGLPLHRSEMAVEKDLAAMAAKNVIAGSVPFFLGAGVYRHHVPAIVDSLTQRGEFLTSYTPYQPEVSQGTLQYLFEFQTQVAMITGMEIANASMYDAATATAEAASMAARATKRKRILLSGSLHPHYRSVTTTSLQFTGYEVEALPPDPLGMEDRIGRLDKTIACVVVQNPDFFGRLNDFSALAEACHAVGALLVVAISEPLSLGAIKSPGAMGADIVVSEGQSIGNGMNFGGPGLGLFAAKSKYLRQMPGRLVGETTDAEGRRGWVLTLSTREQHIRREKATSNICTNSGLCALSFSIHLSLLGEEGFAKLARINHKRAVSLAQDLKKLPGVKILPEHFFNEFALSLPRKAEDVVQALTERGILGGVAVSRFYPSYPEMENILLVAATETNSDEDCAALVNALKEILS